MSSPSEHEPQPCHSDPRPTSRGFSYRPYPAADSNTHANSPYTGGSTDSGDKESASVSRAVGGSVGKVSLPDVRLGSAPRRGGGKRGQVRRFSRKSRKNLLESLASVDWASLRGSGTWLISATLTYPHAWPEDPDACKADLNAFRRRLQRRFGRSPAFWRIGIQRRGAWHFHLLLFLPPNSGSLPALRRFVSSAWYEVCGRLSEDHLRFGASVEEVRSWEQATSYAALYLAKEESFPEGVRTGRVWGVWNKKDLPVRWETVDVGRRDALVVMRAFRKLAGLEGRSFPRGLTVFVRHGNVARLLAFLGYRLE